MLALWCHVLLGVITIVISIIYMLFDDIKCY